MTLIVGINSYVSVEDTDTYFELNNLGAVWPTADSSDKEKALVTATAMIDNDYQFIGVSVSDSQTLAWPRQGAVYLDPRTGRLTETNIAVIPPRVVMAVQELAEHLLVNGGNTSQSEQTFERIKIGPIELEDSSANSNQTSKEFSVIRKLLKPLLSTRASSNTWWRAN
jgi:hypothetical protein